MNDDLIHKPWIIKGENLQLDEEFGGHIVGRIDDGVETGSRGFEVWPKERVCSGRQRRNVIPIAVRVLNHVLPNERNEVRVYSGTVKLPSELSAVEYWWDCHEMSRTATVSADRRWKGGAGNWKVILLRPALLLPGHYLFIY